ncbi:hypothetical protein J5X84_05060 [Streptosporangiaceae bacterium NEAU-GS5]|nr:hypothetical protein [Streptosporangiaceae bacterium NEAU-GS5]
MILISAALVLAAIVLLIAGVVLAKPFLVMWSIVISVLSAVSLLVGALLRRHELFPAGGKPAREPVDAMNQMAASGASAYTATGQHPAAGAMVTQTMRAPTMPPGMGGMPGQPPHMHPSGPPGWDDRIPPSTQVMRPGAAPAAETGPPSPGAGYGSMPYTSPGTSAPGTSAAAAGAGRPPDATGLALDAIVLVIPGRRRFHLATCRQLLNRDTEELTHEEAREEGFTPCSTCLPDGAPPRPGSSSSSSSSSTGSSSSASSSTGTSSPASSSTGAFPETTTTSSRMPSPPARTAPPTSAPPTSAPPTSGSPTPGSTPSGSTPSGGSASGTTLFPATGSTPTAPTAAPSTGSSAGGAFTTGAAAGAASAAGAFAAGTSKETEAESDSTSESRSEGRSDGGPDDSVESSRATSWFTPTRSESERPSGLKKPYEDSRQSPEKPVEPAVSGPGRAGSSSAGDTSHSGTDADEPSDGAADFDASEAGRRTPTPPHRVRGLLDDLIGDDDDAADDDDDVDEVEDAEVDEPPAAAADAEDVAAGDVRDDERPAWASGAAWATGGEGRSDADATDADADPDPDDDVGGAEDAGDVSDVSDGGDVTRAAMRPGMVRVLVGTRRYHGPNCPLLSATDDSDIEVMTQTAAEEAGLTHCSVCDLSS